MVQGKECVYPRKQISLFSLNHLIITSNHTKETRVLMSFVDLSWKNVSESTNFKTQPDGLFEPVTVELAPFNLPFSSDPAQPDVLFGDRMTH